MIDRTSVIAQIQEAFAATPYPGDAFLQGSWEGCEPYEVIAPFKGLTEWRSVEATLLDTQAEALSFFSEGGFRFFLPAFLIADVMEQLQRADPLFHVTHGFHDSIVRVPTPTRVFEKKLGRSVLLNPRRYGAITSFDYARFRLSVFTREEARAIVAYLEYKRGTDADGIHRKEIEAALESFWLDRAATAPESLALIRHVEAEEAYVREIMARQNGSEGSSTDTKGEKT